MIQPCWQHPAVNSDFSRLLHMSVSNGARMFYTFRCYTAGEEGSRRCTGTDQAPP